MNVVKIATSQSLPFNLLYFKYLIENSIKQNFSENTPQPLDFKVGFLYYKPIKIKLFLIHDFTTIFSIT